VNEREEIVKDWLLSALSDLKNIEYILEDEFLMSVKNLWAIKKPSPRSFRRSKIWLKEQRYLFVQRDVYANS